MTVLNIRTCERVSLYGASAPAPPPPALLPRADAHTAHPSVPRILRACQEVEVRAYDAHVPFRMWRREAEKRPQKRAMDPARTERYRECGRERGGEGEHTVGRRAAEKEEEECICRMVLVLLVFVLLTRRASMRPIRRCTFSTRSSHQLPSTEITGCTVTCKQVDRGATCFQMT